MSTKYYIFGGSGHGKVVTDIVLSSKTPIEAILDDHPKADKLFYIPLIITSDYIPDAHNQFVIAVGNNSIRKKIVEKHPFSYFKAISPNSSLSSFAEIGEGTVVMPLALVNAGTKIGKHCIMNSGCVVEHDCVIDDYVHISPNAAIAGHVIIGEGTHVGIGASVIQSIKIGKWATIGAGAVIITDIPDYAVVVGNPGRVIKYNSP